MYELATTALMILAALFVVVPVLRYQQSNKSGADSGSDSGDVRQAKNIALYRQRLEELNQDLAMGLIEESDFKTIETDLKRSFLADMNEQKVGSINADSVTPLWEKSLPFVMLVVILFFGMQLYSVVGAADEMRIPELVSRVNDPVSSAQQDRDFRELSRLLAARYRKNPDDTMNGYMLGTLYMRIDRYSQAASVFKQLSEKLTNEHDRVMVLRLLAKAQAMEESPPLPSGHPVIATEAGKPIQVHVDIDDVVMENLAPGMRLFVFARDPEQNIPLAVSTFEIGNIPDIITLDDSLAMMPQATISSARTLYVGARVSREAIAQSGDFQILTEIFSPDQVEGLISLTIKDAIP